MLIFGGLIFLLLCVFGSFIISGGNISVLIEALPFEFLTIGGAAIGTLVMANSMHGVKHTLSSFGKAIKGTMFHKADYVELLSLLFYFTKLAASKGAMALEPHIERPEESSAFQQYPKILSNGFARSLICDYLRMVGMNADDPYQIEDVMARELRKRLHEDLHGAHALQTVADALPALGIVAAVLGVIKTMSHINDPPAVLGQMIGGALVGTFLGVLLSYGVTGPIAQRIKGVIEEDAKYYDVIRAVLVAHLHGNPPQISIETGRKMVPTEHMPTFQELEETLQSIKVS
jgi:chemotaxis protein MotA